MVVVVAHHVSFAALTLRNADVTIVVLLELALVNHPAEDQVRCLVVLSELLGLRELLLELGDPLLGALLLQGLDLCLFVLPLDVYLSASSLGAGLEQVCADALTR